MNFGNCMIFFQTFVADYTEKVHLSMIELVCVYVSYYLPYELTSYLRVVLVIKSGNHKIDSNGFVIVIVVK